MMIDTNSIVSVTEPNQAFSRVAHDEEHRLNNSPSIDMSDDEKIDLAGATGGEAEHTLTVDEMPSHNHSVTGPTSFVRYYKYGDDYYGFFDTDYNECGTRSMTCANTGGDAAHNNMPPYLAVYVWKRTA